MPISAQYQAGLRDLLINEQTNQSVLLQLAKSVTKNVCSIEEPEEALGYLINMEDIHKLLTKRHFTRELLFKYLSSRLRGGSFSTDFSKGDLVMRVIQYWDQGLPPNASTALVTPIPSEEQFPIHLLARKFSEWFFSNLNTHKLQLADFWTDVCLQLQIIADDGVNELSCASDTEVLATLLNAQQQFGFNFNPNLTHAGVQGRMDPHGLVMVLACGTLHTAASCVGVFECLFGLLRDPYADNNWKMKKIKCLLRSQQAPQPHSLCASNSLQAALTLPAPNEELE